MTEKEQTKFICMFVKQLQPIWAKVVHCRIITLQFKCDHDTLTISSDGTAHSLVNDCIKVAAHSGWFRKQC